MVGVGFGGQKQDQGIRVGMGSAGGPEAGYRDSRTYVDPRPVGPKPDSQASRRALLLSEGGCPVARREERAWLSRVECTPVRSAFFHWPFPFASPSLSLRRFSGCSLSIHPALIVLHAPPWKMPSHLVSVVSQMLV